MPKAAPKIALTAFALRNWQPGASSTLIEGITPAELVASCNAALDTSALHAAPTASPLVDGYAPFCKHLFLPNDTPTRAGFAAITEANRHLLCSGYRARRPGEMAVLERWFENLKAPPAPFFDVILYAHDQLLKEAAAFPDDTPVPDCDWGIVSIIPTLTPEEPPMPPITQLRNALGPSEGGSGVAIDRDAYDRAVAFWERHALVK